MSRSRSQWLIRLHPALTRLAICQYPLDSRDRPSYCIERVIRGAGTNRRGVDIQVRRGEEGLSHGTLDECGAAADGHGGVYSAATLLWMEEQGHQGW